MLHVLVQADEAELKVDLELLDPHHIEQLRGVQ
jgi:hypothetical protein